MNLGPTWTGKIVFTSDWQYPFLDARAHKLAKAVARELKPDLLIFGGDMIDFDSLSRRFQHSVPAERRSGSLLRDECKQLGGLLREFWDVSKAKRAIVLGGNHEARPEHLIREVIPALDGAISVNEWLELDRHGMDYVPYANGNGRVHVGDRYRGMSFLHGFFYRSGKKKDTGIAAMAHMDRLDTSVCHGHTNRCVSIMHRRQDRLIYGLEAGCLCDAEEMAKQYAQVPDQQQGLAFVVMDRGRVEHAQVIRLDGGCAWVPSGRVAR